MIEFLQKMTRPEMLPVSISVVVIIFVLAMILPAQAYRRGHGFFSWLVLQLIAVNPFYLLVILAMLPNKAMMRKRQTYAAELQAKLQKPGAC